MKGLLRLKKRFHVILGKLQIKLSFPNNSSRYRISKQSYWHRSIPTKILKELKTELSEPLSDMVSQISSFVICVHRN